MKRRELKKKDLEGISIQRLLKMKLTNEVDKKLLKKLKKKW